jgi:starch synthase
MPPSITPPQRTAGPADPPAQPLSILMVASEAVPFSKTGGLADVAGSLSSALAGLGHRVTLVVPRYRGVATRGAMVEFPVVLSGRALEAGFFEQRLARGVRAVLVECPELYDRDTLYGGDEGYPDNARRFGFLARFALEFAAREGHAISLVHAHDWHAGLAPVYLSIAGARSPALSRAASVFTIHNMAYQGRFPATWLPALGLGPDLLTPDGLEYWGSISFLKGGIHFADRITTVSPTYAREIQTPEYGFGFEGILARRASALTGVLNGIDADAWDPSRDPSLPETYDAQHLGKKRVSKIAILREFGLPAEGGALDRPLVGMISRLVDQKGMDLMAAAAGRLLRLDASFIVLGEGEVRYQDFWRALAARHPDRVAARIGFDESLAHLIEAGADIFLMPSRFEPCGLSQMYSQRYGTIPVVRATGGLEDTVTDYNPVTGEGTGFTFRDYTPAALLGALDRALKTFRVPGTWRAIQQAGMRQDFSWTQSAREYVKVYWQAIEARRARMGRADTLE